VKQGEYWELTCPVSTAHILVVLQHLGQLIKPIKPVTAARAQPALAPVLLSEVAK
jgi:hypothetical protein